MERPSAESFKQLTISAEKLPASMAQQSQISAYATQRAKLLLGCYRTGDANDPDTYVAAISATLARYSEQIITDVTHPVSGLPAKKSWLPTVKEVFDACEEKANGVREQVARERRIKEQLAAREEEDRLAAVKPSLEQLKEKYGPNWGIGRPDPVAEHAANEAENKAEMVRQRARVHAEYAAVGLLPPSPFALSMTARREMAKRDEFNGAAKDEAAE